MVIQPELFDENICEVIDNDIRYILRRNPYRADEMDKTRKDKYNVVEKLVKKKNEYLSGHKGGKVSAAIRGVERKIERLKIGNWIKVCEQGRGLILQVDEQARKQEAILDGCYVIKTDLGSEVAEKSSDFVQKTQPNIFPLCPATQKSCVRLLRFLP